MKIHWEEILRRIKLFENRKRIQEVVDALDPESKLQAEFSELEKYNQQMDDFFKRVESFLRRTERFIEELKVFFDEQRGL